MTILRAINDRYDVRGSILSELIKSCLKNRSKVHPALVACYGDFVRLEVILYVECFTECLLFGPSGRFSLREYRYNPPSSSNETGYL